MVFLLSEADLESGIRPKRVGLEKDRIWIWMKYSLNLSLCLDGRFSLKGIKRKRTSNSQYSLSIWLFLNSGRLLEQYSLRLPLLLLLSGSPEDRYVGHRSLPLRRNILCQYSIKERSRVLRAKERSRVRSPQSAGFILRPESGVRRAKERSR